LSFLGDWQPLNFGCGILAPFFAGFLTRAHSKVTPAVDELKRKVTRARRRFVFTFFFGPLSIFVSGAAPLSLPPLVGTLGGSTPLMRATS